MRKLSYVFPGQGSQTVGMLSDLQAAFPIVTDTFKIASTVLGYDLWHLVQNGPSEKLNQTQYTQPALLTASISLWQVAKIQGMPQPVAVAGHSLGEYSALVAAEVLEFAEAVRLVQQRGQFMQRAAPLGKGGMVAVLGLPDEVVIGICDELSSGADAATEIVQTANFNAPGQVVIAGTHKALEVAMTAMQAAGAKRTTPLAVSAPFHSQLMQPAAEQMASVLESASFATPKFKVIQNVDGKYHDEPAKIRANLISQIDGAVHWTTSVKTMAADGIHALVECGPGRVLSGLTKRIDKTLIAWSIHSVTLMESALAELQ